MFYYAYLFSCCDRGFSGHSNLRITGTGSPGIRNCLTKGKDTNIFLTLLLTAVMWAIHWAHVPILCIKKLLRILGKCEWIRKTFFLKLFVDYLVTSSLFSQLSSVYRHFGGDELVRTRHYLVTSRHFLAILTILSVQKQLILTLVSIFKNFWNLLFPHCFNSRNY